MAEILRRNLGFDAIEGTQKGAERYIKSNFWVMDVLCEEKSRTLQVDRHFPVLAVKITCVSSSPPIWTCAGRRQLAISTAPPRLHTYP